MRKFIVAAILTAAVLSLNACADCTAPSVQISAQLQAQYLRAVDDARTTSPAKISRYLTPINVENPDLIWENGVKGSRVLVVTWMGKEGEAFKCVAPAGCSGNAVCKEGGECPTYSHDTWVTVVPELKRLFKTTKPEPLRIAQLLGLPPESAVEEGGNGYRYFLELWVSPQDLFRPCPDTEISDTVCEISFPIDSFRLPDQSNRVLATVGPDQGVFMSYASWFNNHARYSYTVGSDPYPWTRLGYTYDWGTRNHVGLSEFVLHGRKHDNSPISVGIKSVKATAEYFRE